MDFGIALPTAADSWKVTKEAEELGFTHAWFYDTQMLSADCFVAMGAAAVNTRRIRLGTGVLVPSNRIAPVAANVLATLNQLAPGRIDFGVGTGFTMIDVKVELYDGKYHTVDSSDMAFQMAGSHAMKDAIEKAGVTLLEPIWALDVMVPEEFTGDIMGDLQKRRGIPEGIDTVGGGRQIVKAKVPFGEVTHYATDLRSMTGGKGTFSWSFSHYQEVPGDVAKKILEAVKEEAHA
jgi:translation elongation factor EF-G